MGLEPSMGWDKPWVYGPILALFHWRTTLWGPLVVQGLLTSYVLWLTQSVLHTPRSHQHLLLCFALAIGTAAPWFTSTLMPDLFTPLVPLCIFVLAFAPLRLSPRQRLIAAAIGTIAIAAHLSHLILAASCIAVIGVVQRAIPWRPAATLAVALAFLLASNAIGHGIVSLSPYGSVFALARLVGDGPARAYIDRVCPEAGYRLCAWKGRLSADSDEFLWHPQGPLWADEFSPMAFAPEATRIVSATLAAYPLEIARAAAANTARQLGRVQLGDTLVPDHLDAAVRPKLEAYFPAAELRRYDTSRQRQGRLAKAAQPFHILQTALLLLGAAATIALLIQGLRHPTPLRYPTPLTALAALVLAALLVNAFATGAFSTVHDRYQARIAWLVLLPPGFALLRARSRRDSGGAPADRSAQTPPYAARLATSSGDIRTRAS